MPLTVRSSEIKSTSFAGWRAAMMTHATTIRAALVSSSRRPAAHGMVAVKAIAFDSAPEVSNVSTSNTKGFEVQ